MLIMGTCTSTQKSIIQDPPSTASTAPVADEKPIFRTSTEKAPVPPSITSLPTSETTITPSDHKDKAEDTGADPWKGAHPIPYPADPIEPLLPTIVETAPSSPTTTVAAKPSSNPKRSPTVVKSATYKPAAAYRSGAASGRSSGADNSYLFAGLCSADYPSTSGCSGGGSSYSSSGGGGCSSTSYSSSSYSGGSSSYSSSSDSGGSSSCTSSSY